MEVNAKDAKNQISSLLDHIQKGEEIVIVRRGKKVARLAPVSGTENRLPDLTRFRVSIKVKGGPLSRDVIEGRSMERY